MGQGLLLYLTAEQKKAGATLEEAAAFVGSTLSLKPIIYVDKEGKLVNNKKVRGRKKSILTLVDMYAQQAEQIENSTVFLAHSDCLEEAKEVEQLLKE